MHKTFTGVRKPLFACIDNARAPILAVSIKTQVMSIFSSKNVSLHDATYAKCVHVLGKQMENCTRTGVAGNEGIIEGCPHGSSIISKAKQYNTCGHEDKIADHRICIGHLMDFLTSLWTPFYFVSTPHSQ